MLVTNIDELLAVYTETLYTSGAGLKESCTEIGNFEKKILAICRQSEWNPGNEEFLSRILHSCQLSEKDYRILVIANENKITDHINHLQPEVLFLFDLNLNSEVVKLNKIKYKPFRFNNIKMVLADTLEVLKSDKEKRNALWNQSIKVLFNIA